MTTIGNQTNSHHNPAHASSTSAEPTHYRTSEESGMQKDQHSTQPTTALLCTEASVDTLETNSLCCAAAGTIASSSSTTEALIPHEKLRAAATPSATLNAQHRPPAQPAVGYTSPSLTSENPSQDAVDVPKVDERAEFEKEFPVPEGLQYCKQRGTYITAPGAQTSDSFAREHYAYRAGFTAWKRRAWKHHELVGQQAKGARP
ncbi:hypothetical protein [Pseudomonas fluorescens]|uniref:hypothetical protein n=1 Tax=Pseudomonas fluorescens TaxID=294 RepID=UPI0012565781|nr:hypothetical protein [Pseudomonas fluorescens]VVQ34599.1 hypothetical protein PS947_04124 [Pseudomonas fluorescens]